MRYSLFKFQIKGILEDVYTNALNSYNKTDSKSMAVDKIQINVGYLCIYIVFVSWKINSFFCMCWSIYSVNFHI